MLGGKTWTVMVRRFQKVMNHHMQLGSAADYGAIHFCPHTNSYTLNGLDLTVFTHYSKSVRMIGHSSKL